MTKATKQVNVLGPLLTFTGNVMVEIKLLRPNAILPTTAHDTDAAVDLYACIEKPITLYPGTQYAIGTGVAVSLPPQVAGLVLPRSGLARKHKLTLGNPPGLIDPGYHGEIIVLLRSFARHGDGLPYVVEPNERIAQLMLIPIVRYPLTVVNEFSVATARGENGFGSTGTH